jgi:tetratricopeptide (TPR) repeat protein
MVDDSVLALLTQEPQWRIADCPIPALLHDGYRPELLAAGNKAARLRQAMEADLTARPGDPYACAKLGSLEVSEGNHQRGMALLELGLSNCPKDAHPERYELLLHLAIAKAETDPAQAAELYQTALQLPLPPRLTLAAQLNLAALLVEAGNSGAAAQLCEQATRVAPEVALGWYNLGIAERQRGQLPAAISAYQRALALDPHYAEAQQNLAVALLLSGDIGGARQGFKHAIGLLSQQGKHQEAQALHQQASTLVKLET